MIKSTLVQPVRTDLVLGTVLACIMVSGLFAALVLANDGATTKAEAGGLRERASMSDVEHQSVPVPEIAAAPLSEWAYESAEHVAGTIELRWQPHIYELSGAQGATDTVGWIYVTGP